MFLGQPVQIFLIVYHKVYFSFMHIQKYKFYIIIVKFYYKLFDNYYLFCVKLIFSSEYYSIFVVSRL